MLNSTSALIARSPLSNNVAWTVCSPVIPSSSSAHSSHLNNVWNSGVRLGSRAGATASSTSMNGTIACDSASFITPLVATSISLKLLSAATDRRVTIMFTKYPTTSWVSGCSRLAYGIPTATSSCPLCFPSSIAHEVSMPRIVDTPFSWHSDWSLVAASASMLTATEYPFDVNTAGRGWSVCSSSTARSPPNVSRQYFMWGSIKVLSASTERCHRA